MRNLIALCGDHPHLLTILPEEALQSIDDPLLSDLLRDARELCATAEAGESFPGGAFTVEKLIALAPPEVRSLVATAALSGKFINTENPEAELYRTCRDLRAHAIQREVIDLQKALIRMTKAGQEDGRPQLLARIQELTHLRSQLLSNSLQGSPLGRPSGSQTGLMGPGEPGGSALATEGDTPR